MRVLVDLLPLLPRGGGLQNARNLWRALGRWGGDHEWLVIARPELELDGGGAHRDLVVLRPATVAHRLWIENARIPELARRWRADAIWTPMGAGPLRGPVPRVLGWHDSSIAYAGSVAHGRMGPGERFVEGLRAAVAAVAGRRAAAITVQTVTMRGRLAALWSVPEARFHLVPNGPSAFLAGEPPAPETAEGPPTVLVVAEPKPAKNLEILPEVARLLRARGPAGVRIVVTVDSGNGPFTRELDRALARAGEAGRVERIGRVPHEELASLYRGAWVVFLPSLFESFSATYVEAMHFGVPLVTSDRDFARDLCGDAALYADPLDPVACAEVLARALADIRLRRRLREEGFRRVRAFPDWEERLSSYVGALEAAVRGVAAPAGAGTRAE